MCYMVVTEVLQRQRCCMCVIWLQVLCQGSDRFITRAIQMCDRGITGVLKAITEMLQGY